MRETKIKLDDEYRIESDSVCWTLVYDVITGKNEKTGKDKRRYETWYYPSLEYGLNQYVDLKGRGSATSDELVSAIRDAVAGVRRALEEHCRVNGELQSDQKIFDGKHKERDEQSVRPAGSDEAAAAGAAVGGEVERGPGGKAKRARARPLRQEANGLPQPAGG